MACVKISGIYRIDLGNGSFYIGSSYDLDTRSKQHLSTLKAKKHDNPRAQNCWDKYGVFEWEVLELCEIDALLPREQYYLDIYFADKNNVNVMPASSGARGYRHSAESRANMAAAQKGRKPTAETLAKQSAARKGKKRPPFSAEWCANIGAAHRGKKNTDAHKEKNRIASTGRKHTDEAKEKMSVAMKGRKCKPFSDEHKANMGASRLGKKRNPHTAETREKMSVSGLARYARERAVREAA